MAHPCFAALHGVDVVLPDGRILFQHLHETFGAETVGLIGANGSGKSTLGRAVAGLLTPGCTDPWRRCSAWPGAQRRTATSS